MIIFMIIIIFIVIIIIILTYQCGQRFLNTFRYCCTGQHIWKETENEMNLRDVHLHINVIELPSLTFVS